jgi:hypothetical protein
VLILFWLAAVSASDYAGAARCAVCHPAQSRGQASTGHARALARARPPQPGEWAFGAGTQAITFVRRADPGHYLEEAQTWYRAINGYGRTPGHLSSNGVRDRIFDPSAAILRCFACHSTGPLSISRDGAIQPHEPGVHCEVCHGPAAAHVQEPARFHPRNPGKLMAVELNRMCGECHRMPLPMADRAGLRDPWNARHQPVMLSASKCFLNSGGRLSCLTCHSPHAPLEQSLKAYDAACVACHATPRHRADTEQQACAECHMPGVQPQPHLVFANHRIAIYSATDSLNPVRAR